MTAIEQEVIEALAENEMLVAQLYKAFSNKFPEDQVFWEKMAEEEAQHAGMIRSLGLEVREGTVQFNKDGLDKTSIDMFRDYVKFSLARASEQEILPKDALETALAVEHDLIERNFFVLFEAKTTELKLVLEGLTSSMREHHRRLVEALEKNKETPKA